VDAIDETMVAGAVHSMIVPAPMRERTPSKISATTAVTALLLCVVAWTVPTTNAYPVVVQVDESSKRCFRFNIPEDDE
jgi:hypothetical protein